MRPVVLLTLLASFAATTALAQTGSVRGRVTLESNGEPMHSARVTLSPLGRTADTAEDGTYAFTDVPAGIYDVIALSAGLSDDHQQVRVANGETVSADFQLRIAAVREQITVSASGREEAVLTQVQSVATLDQIQLTQRSSASLGETLEGELGVSKRSAGPGNSRPVIRGFDGDRVLIMEDGIRTGSLSSQSGDHGEPIDVTKLERVEVVRGPATLLYGSNAIGGVVNAVSRQDTFHQHAHDGARGFITALGGTNNGLGGGSGGFEYGYKKWEFWGSGGGQRSGDYTTPLRKVDNSGTAIVQSNGGLGRYGEKGFFSFNYGNTNSNYGIPTEPEDDHEEEEEEGHHHGPATLYTRRHNYRFTAGWKNIGFLESAIGKVNYSDYKHEERVDDEVETEFFNKQFIYRATFTQKQKGRLGGSFGFWGMHRDYNVVGEEALAPPTKQNAFALFGVESLDFEGLRLQFGGRVENNRYDPRGLRKRSFTGFSGAVGASKRLWSNGVFVANYSHSFRAPALEELYNNGPHPGNVTFEIGNPDLIRERNNGIDLSVRHHSERIRAEANYFYYRIDDFVYLAPTGKFDEGLPVADYLQANSRYTGAEAKLDAALHRNLWLNLAVDGVSAEITSGRNTSLPRIPPIRGRIGFDARRGSFSIRPEFVLASSQKKVFTIETPTAGYAVFNLTGQYAIARQHHMHVFSGTLFNAGDRLYRNHMSFIKAFAPEIGRGVRFSYTVQFF